MIHYLNTITDLKINDASFVVTMKYKDEEKVIAIDHLSKIFIRVRKQTNNIYISTVTILIVVVFYLLKLVAFNMFFTIFIIVFLLLLHSILNFKQYQVVIKLMNGEKHTYNINTNKKTKIVEQVRKIRGIQSLSLFNN